MATAGTLSCAARHRRRPICSPAVLKPAEDEPIAFRVTGDGAVKAGHDTTSPFMATVANDVVTKAYFDANVDLDGGGDYLPLAGGTMAGDIAMGGNRVTGLADPEADAQAATKRYADALMTLCVKRFGNNNVATGAENEDNIFRIRGIKEQGNFFTCISINNESMGLYNVRWPEETHHAANREYVDTTVDDAPFLSLNGGTLSDRLFFERRSGVN